MDRQPTNREAYQQAMRARLAGWVDDVESLRERGGADAAGDHAAELDTLERQFQKFYARLDQFEVVEDDVWLDWKREVDEAAAELGRTIERLNAELPPA